ncbi:CPBP family intramembrane glutamic endopeptidase [Chitinophaga skermanii]|uniref:CPBP family intramembrane glutamic endopeptidase n=1 Tax=Chitinophaga skermanii TaxID=331697 RepID=UPI0013147104|nr:CPBP family intramembrane glutamic endopeptidase [Chitinophaga skermanii]
MSILFCLAMLLFVTSMLYMHPSTSQQVDLVEVFIVTVCIAPVLETVVFQYVLLDYFISKFKWAIVPIGISASVFAAAHIGSTNQFFYPLVAGILLGYCYYLPNSPLKKFLCTVGLHLSVNLAVFAMHCIDSKLLA